MRTHFAKLAALLLGATLAGCGGGAPSTSSSVAAQDALVSNGVTATLSVQSSWGQGFCGNVTMANGGTTTATGWTAVLTFSTGSTLTQVWSASYTTSGSQVTVTPSASNASIAPGRSVNFGFCGNGPSSGVALTSFTASGGTTPTNYTLTIQTSGNGSTSPAAGASSYPAGTVVQVSATPASGSAFAGWSGAASGTTNPVSVTMDGNKTLTASFTGTSTGSGVWINAGGSATGSFGADAYYSGGSTYSTTNTIDTSLLSGTVPPQSVFQTERYGEMTYTIPNLTPGSAQTVTLYFQESYFSAAGRRTFNVAINGTTVLTAFDIYASAGGANKAIARTVSATANASGQVVIAFTRGGGPDNPKICGIGVSGGGDTGPTTYALTVGKSGSGSGTVTGSGISCGSTCSATYTSGTTVTLTAAAASGSTFTGWSGPCSGTSTCTVTMSAAQTVTATFTGPSTGAYTVAMVQSSRSQASDITQSEVADLVASAITQAGGLGFIKDGQTVVLKPNLLTPYTDGSSSVASLTVNGIDTDWRVTKAVADLVRARNPSGKILVMEGSVVPTAKAFSLLGYTSANFGSSVDEFIAVEGSSCGDRSTSALVQRTGKSGKSYWVNSRYVNADVVIDLPVMKTHTSAGITGAVKNLGIGMTPVGQYSGNNGTNDCTRGQTSSYIDHSTPENLGAFIRDFYSLRPPDFVVMDALQGLQWGPLPVWGGGDYNSSKMNMRLVLAGKNAVAVDTIASLVMMCDPKKVPHLTKLEADGLGTTDTASITVVGKQVSEVAKAFSGKQTSICPGTSSQAMLTISVSGSGTTNPPPATYTYTPGTSVSVTATPSSGATFTGWSGAATGTTNPVRVTVSGNTTLTAKFSGGAARPGSACQAGVSYPAPVLTGTPQLVYRPSSSANSGTYEGPVWIAGRSTLLLSDISFSGSVNPSQLLRLTPPSTVTTVLSDAGTNGIAVDGSGTIYAASHKAQGIVKLDYSTGAATTVVDNIGGKKFNSPNDLVLRSDGTIYFTDPDFQLGNRTSQTGTKGVYRVSSSGVVSLVDGTFSEPNGIALSPDETVLYVADYNANVVRAFSVAADGSTSARRDFATVSSPDGFAMDCLGNLYVASGSAGVIQVFSPAGTRLGTISAAASVSNMAFGGSDGKTLYITAGKALYSLSMNLPGYFD